LSSTGQVNCHIIDRIECGSWVIKNEDIEKAHVYKTKQWFFPVNVLQLITNLGTYQFGFNPWANPIKHLEVAYSESNVKLGYSAFSVATRLLLLGIICFEIWKYFSK
jgi:hypothetical protein